ncbi:MAG: SHOCT domain-containing protein [Chloroflexota bacterium]
MNKDIKRAVVIGGIILALLVVGFVALMVSGLGSDLSRYPFGGGGWGMMGGYGWMWFMPLYMIVFWGLVIWGVVSLIRGLGGEPTESDSAMELLKRRYARGEIGKEEFEAKKKDLM